MSISHADKVNQILDNITYNVGSVLNAKYTSNVTNGNQLLSSESLQLSGLNVREKSVKNSDYVNARSFFTKLGINQETASAFAMNVINVAIYSDKSVADVLSELDDRGIQFLRQQYEVTNRIRKPSSQLYSWIDVDNCNDSYLKNRVGLFCREEEPENPE